MKHLKFLLPLVVLAAAAPSPAQAPRDWRQTATLSPDGAVRVGNPAAKVKLAEYLSYTCSHCADFVRDSAPVLKDKLVRSGKVQVEYRHFVRDPLDLASALLARCEGPARFARRNEAIFAAQNELLTKAQQFQGQKDAYKGADALPARLERLARGSGLIALMAGQGLTEARAKGCLANQAEIDRLVGMTRAASGELRGTPSFAINGKFIGSGSWATIEPQLQAAGA